MNFIDRQSTYPDRRKVKKIVNGSVTEEFIADIILTPEEVVSVAGTPINAENLNKGNWRDDTSVSFEKRSDNNLPPAHATKTQIVTKSNGEVWFIPPTGGGDAHQVGAKGDNGKSVLYLNDNVSTTIDGTKTSNFSNFSATPKLDDLVFSKNNCLGLVHSLSGNIATVKTKRYLLELDSDNPENIITEDTLQTKLEALLPTLLLSKVYPLGSIYMSTNNESPATFLGGSWIPWGAGRVPVSVNTDITLFNAADKTGGNANSIVPSHTHTISGGASTSSAAGSSTGRATFGFIRTANGPYNSHSGVLTTSTGNTAGGASGSTSGRAIDLNINLNIPTHTHSVPAHAHTVSTVGSSVTNANLQPYITCYMWKRTA